MELRRLGKAAFRSSTRDLPFTQLLQLNRQNVIRTPIAHRALSTTSRTYAIKPEPTIRAPFTQESPSTSASPSNTETPNVSPASPRTPKEDTLESLGTSSMSQTLSFIKSVPSHRLSTAQLENTITSSRSAYNPPPLKSTSLLNRLSNPQAPNPSSTFPRYPAVKSQFDNLQIPNKKTGTTGSSAELMNETVTIIDAPSAPRAEMRLSPRTGRTIDIKSNIDLSRGIRMLEASCALNKVRQDHTYQRFHERGGMKRKRLRRQRWRNNFMAGFKGIVGRVKQLKNQGW